MRRVILASSYISISDSWLLFCPLSCILMPSVVVAYDCAMFMVSVTVADCIEGCYYATNYLISLYID